ncbi:hypothetical protein [Candidatus Arthromitus sp. SFB-rat-Yit]|uniref:hypothetical protein n=1 Tax=Candidatus Arthromitus sp. SFB-rat-Yit TaxID=1041504 RepID=UPI000227A4D2|nr:hypothetical protein [Candidatus Arthromitus sp. SFB-rat-Yit]BAK80957.1 hypothetical protein RATSFB_0395 [Candidatus Arthromitus sp. SFB-rat-Yit]
MKSSKLLLKIIIFILCILVSIKFHTEFAYANDNFNKNVINVDKIEKYWWGCRRYMSSDQVSKFSNDFDLLAAEFSLIGGLSTPISFLNPLLGIITSSMFEISSSYCWLLSTYLAKVDRGNGIIIDFINGFIFRVRAI